MLVHVGFAISRIDEEAARETLAALAEIGALGDEGAPRRADGDPPRPGAGLMRHVDEYRDPAAVEAVVRRIHETVTRPWTLMEVCGGQTHSILKFGLDELLPAQVRLVHGPGCPVCVTPLELIDRAIAIASRPDVIFCSFGDMLRVPGSRDDLLKVKARGGDVRIVYSPLDAAAARPRAPRAQGRLLRRGLRDDRARQRHGRPPRREARASRTSRCSSPTCSCRPPSRRCSSAEDAQIQGLLAPGHVCAVTGYRDYEPVAATYRIPIVVTGFEPLDLLRGVLAAVTPARAGRGAGREPVPARGRPRGQPRRRCA